MKTYVSFTGNSHSSWLTTGKRYPMLCDHGTTFNTYDDAGDTILCLWNGCNHIGGNNWTRHDEPDTPPLLGDMTDAEIGALVRAQNEEKQVQRWHGGEWDDDDFPAWCHYTAYRVKPEPVRETVTIYINEKGETAPRDDTTSWAATRAITFDKIDGKIDDSTPPKMERVKW